MKKKNILIMTASLLLVVLCLGTLYIVVSAEESSKKMWFNSSETTDAYEFPITPTETPEKWREFQTYQEMLNACQIPEEKLKTMSTEGLIETCLSYPLMGNIMLNNSTYQGFINQISEFNGLKELLTRNDLGSSMCKLYYNLSFEDMLKTDKYPASRLRYFEYIISQPDVLEKINHEEKQKLLDFALEIAKTKLKKHSETFSVMPTALIIGRLLKGQEEFENFLEENPEVKHFVETGTNFTSEAFSKIITESDCFAQKVKEGWELYE